MKRRRYALLEGERGTTIVRPRAAPSQGVSARSASVREAAARDATGRATAALQRILRAPGRSWAANEIRGFQSAVGNRAVQRALSSMGETETLRRAGTAAAAIERHAEALARDDANDDRGRADREGRAATLLTVARAIDALDWPAGRPRIVLVPAAEVSATAVYDPATHTIRANADEPDEVKLWDNVLFQARRALEQQQLDRARAEGEPLAVEDASPASGPGDAGGSFDAFMLLAQALRAAGGDAAELSDEARDVLSRADAYDDMPPDDAREAFAGETAVPGLAEKAALCPEDLAGVERLAGWTRAEMIAWVDTALAPLFDEYGGPFSDVMRPIRAVFERASWPADPAQRARCFDDLVAAAIAATEIEAVRQQLRSFRLSPAAGAAADAAAEGE